MPCTTRKLLLAGQGHNKIGALVMGDNPDSEEGGPIYNWIFVIQEVYLVSQTQAVQDFKLSNLKLAKKKN